MARLPRYGLPGQPQHVIQRGNNRNPIFFAPEDYTFFLECLRDSCKRHDCAVHAYVLMTNHVHLLVSPKTSDGIAKLMQSLGRRYVQYINFTYQRSGTLWEGRYKAVPMDSDGYVMTCYRYIEMNPIRAGTVVHPSGYRRSSYSGNADGKPDALLKPHALYRALGLDDASRRIAYRKLFRTDIDAEQLDSIREAINKGWALGNDKFKRKIEKVTQRRVSPLARGGKRRGAGRPKQKDENK